MIMARALLRRVATRSDLQFSISQSVCLLKSISSFTQFLSTIPTLFHPYGWTPGPLIGKTASSFTASSSSFTASSSSFTASSFTFTVQALHSCVTSLRRILAYHIEFPVITYITKYEILYLVRTSLGDPILLSPAISGWPLCLWSACHTPCHTPCRAVYGNHATINPYAIQQFSHLEYNPRRIRDSSRSRSRSLCLATRSFQHCF